MAEMSLAIEGEPECSVESWQQLVVRYRPAGRKLALGLLSKWNCRIDADGVQSIVDISLCEAALRFNAGYGTAFLTFYYFHLKGGLIRELSSRKDHSLKFVDTLPSAFTPNAEPEEFSVAAMSLWDDESTSIEESIYSRQLAAHCAKVCQRMKSPERDVIERLVFGGESVAKVSSELGISRGHIFRIRKTALCKLQQAVKRYRYVP